MRSATDSCCRSRPPRTMQAADEARAPTMDFRQLRYFVAIVDCGSLSKAAKQVYVAQPALSQQIAGLESELDTQLLLRSSRAVKPTEALKRAKCYIDTHVPCCVRWSKFDAK
jgi:hypothetical protein